MAAALSPYTHTHTHTKKKNRGVGKEEWKKKNATQSKERAACLLPQLSTSAEGSQKELGSHSSFALQGTFKMGSGPKTKAQERHGKTTAPPTPPHNS